MRLIDADALGNRLYHEVFEKDSEDQRWDSGCWMRYRLFEKVLKEQPTVEQPERKKGRWSGSCCSVCGVSRYNFIKILHTDSGYCGTWKYCPNCGAKMEVSE